MSIGERIRNKRIEKGLTQEELAVSVGYTSKSTINKIELGINDIPLSKVCEFARALSTTESYLMGWDDEASSSAAVPVPAADPNEDQLIAMYRELNSAGQKKLREYAEDLLDNDKYKKDSIESVVAG